MENTTSETFLYTASSTEGPFSKLVDITSYPDIFTAPEKLDISDLSSNQKKYAPGMVDLPDYEFGFVYNKTDYDKLKALQDDTDHVFQIRFGETGQYGAWQFSAKLYVTPVGGGVGAVREGKITLYPSGEVTETVVA